MGNIAQYIRKTGLKGILKKIGEKGVARTFADIFVQVIDGCIQKAIVSVFRKKPLKNTIVITSHNDFDNNGGAFYDYLIENGYNTNYKIVWLLLHSIPKNLPYNVLGFKLKRISARKDYYISTAKYFTSDCFVVRKTRSDQISYYFGHGNGIPIKNVIMDMSRFDVDYFLVSSKRTEAFFAKHWNIPYPNDKMLNFGFPSNDILFKDSEPELRKLTDKKYANVFLWMPTFRKLNNSRRNDSTRDYRYGIPLIETPEAMDEMQTFLAVNDSLLIIKIHPHQAHATYDELTKINCENIKILTASDAKSLNISPYLLMKDADALIGDYSSSVFPFMLLNRPIAFVLSDLNDYTLGLSVENPDDIFAGEKIYTLNDFKKFLIGVATGKDEFKEKRNRLVNYLNDYIDGGSCARIAAHMGLEKPGDNDALPN